MSTVINFSRTSPSEVNENDLILINGYRVRTVHSVIPPASPQAMSRDEHWVVRYYTGKFTQTNDPILSEVWVYPGNRLDVSRDAA